MSDAFLVPLRASEHSRDFHKPVTVKALARFDPDLEIIRNRRNGAFEVHRKVLRWRQLWLGPEDGYLSFSEPMHIYVCDVCLGLEGFDDPTALLAYLEAGDVRRHPRLCDERDYAMECARYKIQEKVTDTYRHAFRENKRLLYKAWEPLVNSPSFVR